MAARKHRPPIKDSEWEVTIQLVIGDGVKIGDPVTMHFADSVVAACPPNVDFCVGGRINELAQRLKPLATKARKK